MQDLADAGKLVSDGWAFFNSINTERAWGGNPRASPPLESGASQNDMDYLHVINWRKAEELVKAGKTRDHRRHEGHLRSQTAPTRAC
jgi:nitrous-oxide reductase